MNILLLIFDDLAPMLGCYNDPIAQTPHIDRLADRGVVFDQCYTPCAICAPGRATLFTGLEPDQHGVTTLQQKLRGKRPDLITWPQALRSRGWYTMRSGKVFHKGVPECACFRSDGDDDPYAWVDKYNPGGLELNCNGTMQNYTPWQTHTAGIGGAICWLEAEKSDSIHHDTRVADDAVRAITTADQNRSNLWAAGFIRPHVPLVAPKRFFDLYRNVDPPLPTSHPDATPLAEPVTSQWCSNFNLSDEQRREAIRAYYACISFVDEQVGRIIDALDRSEQAEQTMIILTADHGFQLGEHGLWFKNFPYQQSMRIPLIIADPDRPQTHGQTCRAMVEQTDLFPTLQDRIQDLADVKQSFDGRSLLPLLNDPTKKIHHAVHGQVDWQQVQCRTLRTEQYSYFRWSGDHEQEQLFDRQADPGEQIDLLQTNQTPEQFKQLRRWLNAGRPGCRRD